jgi:nitrate reductase NapD
MSGQSDLDAGRDSLLPIEHPSGKENLLTHLCISSLVVHTHPARLETVRNRLEAIPEAEVVGESKEGKLVVVLDSADNREAANTITDLQNQADILSASLIYQYDDQFRSQVEDSA